MEVDIKVVDQNTEELLIISGMSGSGKSTVIKALEDIGYFCVDNFPAAMINELLNHLTGDDRKYDKVALTIDTRSIQSVDEYANVIDELNERDIPFTTLFLDSEDDVLLRRYKETRRLHPFMDAGRIGLEEAIAKERDFLNSVKNGSDMILDTSHLSTAETKQKIIELFDYDLKGRLNVHFISFGFKYGILQDADIVFDVRCLKNPYYDLELRHMTGNDQVVRDFVMESPDAKGLFEHIKNYLEFSIPLYLLEGKSQLIVGIGCTGGKHRSVTFANLLKETIKHDDINLFVDHRDIKKK